MRPVERVSHPAGSGAFPDRESCQLPRAQPAFAKRCFCFRASSGERPVPSAAVACRDRQSGMHSQTLRVFRAALLKSPQRQRARRFQEQRFVQGGQRLQRRIRADAANAGEVAVGRIERLQHRIGHRPETERVQRAAIAIRPVSSFQVFGP